MPEKTIIAPSIFLAEKLSPFMNKNEKQENKRGAVCFSIAAFEPSVTERPTYVKP